MTRPSPPPVPDSGGLSLPGAKVLVTGASTGIGRALALALAREGAVVAAVARRMDLLDEVVEQCRATGSTDSTWYAVDLSDPRAAERLALQVWDELDGLDAIVHNAGMPMRKHALRLTGDEVEQVIAVNYISPVRMTLALLPRMLERGHGSIVAVGSVAGRWGISRESAYSGSKFALTGFLESLRVDLTGSPIDVRIVQPGPIDTPIWDQPGNEPGAYAGAKYPPEDVADAVLAALRPGRFETFVPPGMADVVAMKNADPDAFMAYLAASDAAGGGIAGGIGPSGGP